MKTYFITAILSVASVLSLAQSPQRIEATRMVQEGDNYLQWGRFDDAIFKYTNAIATDESYTEALIKRSELYHRVGRYTEAERDLEKARRINPASAYVLDASAKLNYMSNDYDEGLADIEAAIEIDPSNLLLIDHRADGSILAGSYKSALEDIEQLIDSEYQPELSQLKKALTLYLADDTRGAEAASKQVLEINDSNNLALELLGFISLKENKIDSAITYFDQALAINPLPKTLYNKGVAHRMRGDNQEALELFNQAIQSNLDSAKSYLSRGNVLQDLGMYSASIADFSEVEESDPFYFQVVFHRAYSHKMVGDLPSALDDANKAVELRPRDAKALALRGNIHLLYGDYDEAIFDYQDALIWDSELSEARFNMALAMLMDHRLREGCAEMRRAVREGYEEGQSALSNFCGP